MAKLKKERAKGRSVSMSNEEWSEVEKAMRHVAKREKRSCSLTEFARPILLAEARRILSAVLEIAA